MKVVCMVSAWDGTFQTILITDGNEYLYQIRRRERASLGIALPLISTFPKTTMSHLASVSQTASLRDIGHSFS